MPIYFDILLSFLISVFWVKRAHQKPALSEGKLNWALIALIVFHLVILTPLQSYSFRFHHDWTMAYLINPREMPGFDAYLGLWAALGTAVTLGAGYLGYLVGRISIEKPRSNQQKRALIFAAVLGASLAAVFFKEFLYVGTYEEFFDGNATLWFATVVGWVGIFELAACGAFIHYAPKLLAKIPEEILTH